MALIEYLQRSIYMNLIYEDRYQLILSGLWVTLLLTISSFALGTILGMVFCAGKGSRNKVVRGISNGVTALMVKLPPLVLLMIFAFSALDRKAALLQIPYLLWLTFAGYLNWGIYLLNPA